MSDSGARNDTEQRTGPIDPKQLRRLGFDEKPALEIHSGRQVVKGVGRPRKAIDATVLAAAISIH